MIKISEESTEFDFSSLLKKEKKKEEKKDLESRIELPLEPHPIPGFKLTSSLLFDVEIPEIEKSKIQPDSQEKKFAPGEKVTVSKRDMKPPKAVKKIKIDGDDFFVELAQSIEFKRFIYKILYGKVHRTEKQHGNLDEKVKRGLQIFRNL